MSNLFLPHVLLWIMTCLVSLLLTFIIWPRRRISGGWYLLLFAIGIVEWSLAGTIEAMVTDQATKILWSQIEYLGFTLIPPFLLIFTKAYLSKENLKVTQVLPWFIFPVLTNVIVWTNSYHQLIWTGFTPGNQALNILIYKHGPWFYVNSAYTYILLGLSVFYLIKALFSHQQIVRWQVSAILVSLLFPFASGTAYLFGWEPVKGMDISALGFVFTGLIITLAILRFQLFDLMPVARAALVEHMRDGIIVIDEKERIVDLNPAVQKIFQVKSKSLIGKNIREILPEPLVTHLSDGSFDEAAYEMLTADAQTYFDVNTVSLKNKQNLPTGTLIILSDITQRKKVEFDLKDSNIQLQDRLTRIAVLQESLQEQAVRDPLTNLFNRRYLEETLSREINRAQRAGLPVSVIMMDIDHFKTVNDRYGHITGDQVLQALAQLISTNSRGEDIACRFGGEEFLLILPGSTIDCAVKRADEWRQKFSEMKIDTPHGTASATLSVGVVVFPGHGETAEDLIHTADQAMYKAKENGGNQVFKQPLPVLD